VLYKQLCHIKSLKLDAAAEQTSSAAKRNEIIANSQVVLHFKQKFKQQS
jgi:hypothetical protein